MRRLAVAISALAAIVLIGAIVLSFTGADKKSRYSTTRYGEASPTKAVPAAAASPADDGNWTMPGKDYAATRFSGLSQITPANVGAGERQDDGPDEDDRGKRCNCDGEAAHRHSPVTRARSSNRGGAPAKIPEPEQVPRSADTAAGNDVEGRCKRSRRPIRRRSSSSPGRRFPTRRPSALTT